MTNLDDSNRALVQQTVSESTEEEQFTQLKLFDVDALVGSSQRQSRALQMRRTSADSWPVGPCRYCGEPLRIVNTRVVDENGNNTCRGREPQTLHAPVSFEAARQRSDGNGKGAS